MEEIDLLFDELKRLLESIDNARYSISLEDGTIKAWSFDDYPAGGTVPCRFLIAVQTDMTGQISKQRSVSIEYTNSHFTCNYELTGQGPTFTHNLLKVLINMRNKSSHPPDKDFCSLIHLRPAKYLSSSTTGYSKEDFLGSRKK